MTRRLLAVLAALLLLAGCEPARSGPPDNRPPRGPDASQPTGNPAAYQVFFVIGVTGPAPSYIPLSKPVTLVITGLTKSGAYAEYVDAEGKASAGPVRVIRGTGLDGAPIRWGMTLGAGVVSGSITATYLGTAGERVWCYVERDGVQVGPKRESRIEYTASGRGGAEVYCLTV